MTHLRSPDSTGGFLLGLFGFSNYRLCGNLACLWNYLDPCDPRLRPGLHGGHGGRGASERHFAGPQNDCTEVWFGGIWLHVLAPEGSWELPGSGDSFWKSPTWGTLVFSPLFKWTLFHGNKLLVFQHPVSNSRRAQFRTRLSCWVLSRRGPCSLCCFWCLGTNQSKKAESWPPYFWRKNL